MKSISSSEIKTCIPIVRTVVISASEEEALVVLKNIKGGEYARGTEKI